MKIGILGAGIVGKNLAKAWAAHGYQIMLSSREPASDRMTALINEIGENAVAGTVQQTVGFAEIIVLALSWPALIDVVKNLDALQNKLIIDTTNRFAPAPPDSIGSAAQDIAHWTGASVIKAFNAIGAEHYLNPTFGGQQASMFICGDHAEHKATVMQLTNRIGFEAVDAGPLEYAEYLEAMAKLWVRMSQGTQGRHIAFKLLRR